MSQVSKFRIQLRLNLHFGICTIRAVKLLTTDSTGATHNLSGSLDELMSAGDGLENANLIHVSNYTKLCCT